MATGTPSPTPSEDNRKNNRDDTMYSALDKVMGNSVQSYEDFLNSFTFLKTGMQEKQVVKKEQVDKSSDKRNKTRLLKNNENAPDLVSESKARIKDSPVKVPESQDIEEEILCEGDTTSRINKTKVIKTGSLVKFDNFVDPVADGDEDDIDDIEDMSTQSYSASFSSGISTRNSAAREMVNIVPETVQTVQASSNSFNDDGDVTDMLNTHLSLDENSTDKLLLNFLADLQNEKNEQTPGNTSQLEAASSEMDIENFLHKNKEPKKQHTPEVKEASTESEDVNFNSDDDDNDAIDLLCDDSETNDVKVKITEEDFKTMKVPDQKVKARLDDIYRSSLRDSEGNVQIVKANENTCIEEHGAVDFDKLVFPGQVEERNDEPGVENDRLLDFKATFRESSVNSDIQVESTDLVQPFKLDEDFDYDNVVLTPKFSSEDLRQIKLTVKSQTAVM
ncbi:uncharacterized protein LOC132744232 isoform X2 [Ruditapes philippinarum]|uniref:uncharacterized protein LOC132744232 isoform X2 n=1 Tax=Ruditapes philippinarum TaxID=129788 RepID=UPI00295A949A|nr:uncharacterized protein LOC132744232 isoform X2 [Ruditapes philippinarum]